MSFLENKGLARSNENNKVFMEKPLIKDYTKNVLNIFHLRVFYHVSISKKILSRKN